MYIPPGRCPNTRPTSPPFPPVLPQHAPLSPASHGHVEVGRQTESDGHCGDHPQSDVHNRQPSVPIGISSPKVGAAEAAYHEG